VNPTRRLGPGQLHVRSRLIYHDGSKTAATAELVREIPESLDVAFIPHINYELRRDERYVALFAGLKLPISFALEGVENFGYSGDLTDVFLTSTQRWELPYEIEGIYRSAGLLLSALPHDSYLGKAAENIGASAVDDDPDTRFVHAWNGIELLAKAHFFNTNPNTPEVATDGQRTRTPNIREIGTSLVAAFHDGAPTPDLDWLNYLRNGSAHGGLSDRPEASFDEFLERWDKAEALRDLAFELLVNYLGHRGVIPVAARPVRARIRVPSLRPEWKVEPIDESEKLSRRGIGWKR
jgi:hypothetical protein